MGKYTILEDPRVDEYIDRYLGKVVEVILDSIPSSYIRSILLGGSFGKGEGSVIIDEQGIKPQRDFDICIVVWKNKANIQKAMDIIRKRFENSFSNIKDPDYKLAGDLIPEIGVTTLDDINSLPDISTYDLKKCKLLYGADIRAKIKWELKDLPLRTNARALFQKAIALIGVFHTKYLNEGIPLHLKDTFLRETSRAYIEICVGLCLLANRYDSSCIHRLKTLQEIYKKDFPDLYEKIPDLVEKVAISTKYKLDPVNNKINADPLDYWFETRDDLGEVIKYYNSRYLNIPFKNWPQFAASIERQYTKSYYLPVINAFLRNRCLPTNYFTLNLFNLLLNIKENIEYSILSIRNQQLSVPLLYGISSPVIKIFSTAPLILFSIDRKVNIDSENINKALKKLRFVRTEKKKHENLWEEARSKFLKAVFSVNMF